MSYQQPGPYGQQPQGQPGPYGAQPPQGPPPGSPNPYAQGGAPGAPAGPGHGFPQQPGPQPYGYPQQPAQPGQPPYGYPQQPAQPGQPGQPPYGQQPAPFGQAPGQQPPYGQVPGQPPRGGGNRTPLIVAAVVVALAVAAGLGFVLLGGDDGGGGPVADDGTRYRVELPQTSGQFQRTEASSEQPPTAEELREAGLQDMESDDATYLTMDPQQFQETQLWDPGTLTMGAVGMWGEVADPEEGVDAMFAIAAAEASSDENAEFTLEGDPTDFSDEEAALKCQIGRGTQPDDTLGYLPEATVCVWADFSTVGLVYYAAFPDLPPDYDPYGEEIPTLEAPETVSLEDAAEYTRTLRADSLQEIGDGQSGGGN